jgi:hypothetical protein
MGPVSINSVDPFPEGKKTKKYEKTKNFMFHGICEGKDSGFLKLFLFKYLVIEAWVWV